MAEQNTENKAPEQKQSAKPVETKVSEQKPASFKHIIRIANVDLKGEKAIKVALRKIKGISFNLAAAACNLAGVDQSKKAGELTEDQAKKLNDILRNPLEKGVPVWLCNCRREYETGQDKHLLTGDLDFTKDNYIKRMRKIKCYRGVRHSAGKPVRGQRTKSNFRKSKGKVVGVARKKGAKTGK